MSKISGRHLLVCEEALRDFNGHWFEYDRAVAEMNRSDGVYVRILAHSTVGDDVVEAIGAEPFFEFTNWDGIYYHPQAWRRYLRIARHNLRVFRKMWRFFRGTARNFDLVFVPTVVIFHLPAWWMLARWFGRKKFKRLVLLIRNSATTYDSDEVKFSSSARILGQVLRRFEPMIRRGLVDFATDSHRLAEEYRSLAGIGMTVFPHPCCLVDKDVAPVTSPKSPPVVFSPGPARWEKGTHLLLKAAERIESVAYFLIQWPSPVFSPDGEELNPIPEICEYITQPLSSDDYEARLAESACIALPYLREHYYARISGVAVEAMMLGLPIVYTEDTWIADMVERYGAGLGFPSGDSAALAECIDRIVGDLDAWRLKAQERAPSAKSAFSKTNFQERLWGTSLDDK